MAIETGDDKSKALNSVWYILMRNKSTKLKTVYSHLQPKQIKKEDRAKPHIAAQIQLQGYYEISNTIPEHHIHALEELVSLRYVEKKHTTIYKVWLTKTLSLNHLYVLPTGSVAFAEKGEEHSFKSYYLDTIQYETFETTFNQASRRVDDAEYSHVKRLDGGVELHYQTDIYEIKDLYFDALWPVFSSDKDKSSLFLTEPRLEMTGTQKPQKNWVKQKKIELEWFFSNRQAIDNEIRKLQWKKRNVGIIIFDDIPYFISWPPLNKKRQIEEIKPSQQSPRDRLEAFKNLIKKKHLKEKELQTFLENNYWFFGSKYTQFKAQQRAGKNIMDLFLEDVNHAYTIVELKLPGETLFTKTGGTWHKLTHAIDQVAKAQQWYNKHYEYVFTEGRAAVYNPRGLVVIGRAKQEEEEELERLNSSRRDIKIVTYDHLLKQGEQYITTYAKLRKQQ
jgi:hypothetical protein